MKIYLDLLPQERKKEIKRSRIFRSILHQQLLFLLPFVVFIVVLINIYYVLNLELNSTISLHATEQSQDSYQQLNKYEDKFASVNSQVAALLKIQANHLHWSTVISKLNDTIPGGITITELSSKDYQVFLAGKAKTRDDLLNLKDKLQGESCFSSVNVPLSDLVVKQDLDFQVDFMIDQKCLKGQK